MDRLGSRISLFKKIVRQLLRIRCGLLSPISACCFSSLPDSSMGNLKKFVKVTLVAISLLAIGAFFFFGGQKFLDLSYLKSQELRLLDYYRLHSGLTICAYSLIYILATALSFPGA